MMHLNLFALVIAVSFSLGVIATELPRGGEGPLPFKPIQGPLPQVAEPTKDIADFIYWEDKKQIVFRDEHQNVYSLNSNDDQPEFLTTMALPLAQATDPFGRFFLTAGDTQIFDTQAQRWEDFTGTTGNVQHVFFGEGPTSSGSLYSLSEQYEASSSAFYPPSQVLRVYKYNPGTSFAYTQCELRNPSRYRFKFAKGSHYPYIYMYKLGSSGMSLVATFKWDVRNCKITNDSPFFQHFGYRIEEVYRFTGIDATGVKLDVPASQIEKKGNFHWQSKKGYKLYNVGNAVPLYLNRYHPMMAVWYKDTGLHLVHFDNATIAKVFHNDYSDAYTTERDLWLSRDGRELFMAPKNKQTQKRRLFKLTFER